MIIPIAIVLTSLSTFNYSREANQQFNNLMAQGQVT